MGNCLDVLKTVVKKELEIHAEYINSPSKRKKKKKTTLTSEVKNKNDNESIDENAKEEIDMGDHKSFK